MKIFKHNDSMNFLVRFRNLPHIQTLYLSNDFFTRIKYNNNNNNIRSAVGLYFKVMVVSSEVVGLLGCDAV
jgi:hypothetical protein